MLGWASGLLLADELLALIPFCVGFLLPLPIIVIVHHRLVKKYKKKK